MAKCLSCGANVDGMKFCGECGARVSQEKECPACHVRMPIATKFCSGCGYNFSGAGGRAVTLEKLDESASDHVHDLSDAVDDGGSTVTGSVCSKSVR